MKETVLTFILAGGRGERLDPLTRDRAKPAVPFAGNYRIIDFTLSNCVNSGLRRIYVLTQYKSFSLQKHLLSGWDVVSTQLGEFIDVIPAQQRIGRDWYLGTADAIHQNTYAIDDWNPQLVLILAGDHIYKMDYREMIKYHQEKKADVTVACIPMPKETSKDFGVIQVDEEDHIRGFQEKPESPHTIPDQPDMIFASMGIYLFSKDALLEELELDSRDVASSHDFGKNIIPQMLAHKRKVYVYNYVNDDKTPKYWRDIGTRDAYYQANMDLVKTDKPAFNLYDKEWPLRTYHEPHPPVRVRTQGNGAVVDSIVSGGCIIEGAVVKKSILSNNVKVLRNAQVENSIIMEDVVISEGAKIRNAIIDKEVVVPAHCEIGYDIKEDKKRFVLTTSGIVIVPKRATIKE